MVIYSRLFSRPYPLFLETKHKQSYPSYPYPRKSAVFVPPMENHFPNFLHLEGEKKNWLWSTDCRRIPMYFYDPTRQTIAFFSPSLPVCMCVTFENGHSRRAVKPRANTHTHVHTTETRAN